MTYETESADIAEALEALTRDEDTADRIDALYSAASLIEARPASVARDLRLAGARLAGSSGMCPTCRVPLDYDVWIERHGEQCGDSVCPRCGMQARDMGRAMV